MFRNFSRLNKSILNPSNIRKLATAAPPGPQVSVLANGLTVASQSVPYALTATVGVWIDSGSRSEDSKNNGVAHFLEHLAFKGTQTRSQRDLELEIENIGSHLNAYTSRENTVYYAKTLQPNINHSLEILSDILTKSSLATNAIDRERDVIIRESEEVGKMYDEVIFDHLHAVAYKNNSLGRTILGPIENICSLQRNDLVEYIKENYKGDRMVLVGTGSVNHDELCEFANKSFGHLLKSKIPNVFGQPKTIKTHSFPDFNSDEIKIKESSLPETYMALAVEGTSWNSPDYFTALVCQALAGNWNRSVPVNNGSPGIQIAIGTGHHGEPLANSYMSFSTSYIDTGLWGMYITTDGIENYKLIQAILNHWKELKKGMFYKHQFETAKSQLKASLLVSVDGTTALAEDIGRQMVNTGKILSPEEVFDSVNKITEDNVVDWFNKKLGAGKLAIAALGNQVDTMPSHKEICNEMVRYN
ncbi:mitochondrial processing peptidase ASCRUDRAFT_37617 [Ascoidea rubescens DSM 1968]|uniref:mitochondrial processing peptidase n=1 Tax=Ascoidea rubescens DSM 1968 TaxID=1344418 RepID=A0A1D2VD00_9ASCO|nr:hypothetical protein ASCRUDRAFT_37617 [Ascoidea rubescens DSM 1968]ODV59347.1 hypothetical protein ASCRUDRAFT_37617 [Ascoidea rubescens DSM 1968]